MPRWIKLIGFVVLGAVAVFLVGAPRLLNSFYLRALSEALIYGLLAMSIDILVGYTGLATLGQAGIFGVSAYVVGYLAARMGQPMYVTIPAGILGAFLVSLVFGAMAIRTSGIYFLMITLAEGMIVWGLAYRWDSVTGAENGIRGISRPGVIGEYWKYYYVVLIAFLLLSALMYRIVNSPFGLTLKGIREGERRMRTLGYNVALHKFLGFVVSGVFAGIAGAFYAYHNNFVSPTTVDFALSAEALLMVILGGTGTLFGAVIGSVVITLSRYQISLYTDRWPMVMGAIFVVTILFAPDGQVGGTRRLLGGGLPVRRGPIPERDEVPGRGDQQPAIARKARKGVMTEHSEVLKSESGGSTAPID